MLAKLWKKILLAIVVIAILFNLTSKFNEANENINPDKNYGEDNNNESDNRNTFLYNELLNEMEQNELERKKAEEKKKNNDNNNNNNQ